MTALMTSQTNPAISRSGIMIAAKRIARMTRSTVIPGVRFVRKICMGQGALFFTPRRASEKDRARDGIMRRKSVFRGNDVAGDAGDLAEFGGERGSGFR